MRILVTGVKGQLGHDVVAEMEKRGLTAVGVDVEEMDITDREACERVITEAHVDAVIHCAAYTAVDAAEDNVELCRRVNADGTRNVAEVCKKLDIKMMYISTDYVFDGQGTRPWEPDDERHPLNVYGRPSMRASWRWRSWSRSSSRCGSLGCSRKRKEFRKDHAADRKGKGRGHGCGRPDRFAYLYLRSARLLVDMIQTEKYGRYHATNEGLCSWYEFACEIFRAAGMNEVKVTPVPTSGYPASRRNGP